MKFLRRISLPLFARELTEQAAQPRTYLVRIGYAVMLFVTAMVMFADVFQATSGGPFAVLGQGGESFKRFSNCKFTEF